jgi:hypothetical protein
MAQATSRGYLSVSDAVVLIQAVSTSRPASAT